MRGSSLNDINFLYRSAVTWQSDCRQTWLAKILSTLPTMNSRDYTAYIYLAVYISKFSDLKNNPSFLSSAHPSVTYLSQVGALDDVQLVTVPRADWEGNMNEILGGLKSLHGVTRVEVQEAKQRAKRSKDEF